MTESRDRLIELIREHSYKEGDFLLASGKRSSFYIDLRRTSLTSEGAMLSGELMLENYLASGWDAAALGGMTLGADPLTTAVGIAAFRRGLNLSCFIVRKEPKGHGAKSQVEVGGDLADGAKVVLLEDTTTTGGSTLRAANVMRAAGYDVVGAICLVDRGEGAAETLGNAGVPLRSVFTLDDLRS